MKKIISLIICATIVLSCVMLSSCTAEDPQTLVNDAMAKLMAHDTFEAKMLIATTTTANGNDLTIPVETHLQVIGAKSDSPEIFVKTAIDILGTPFVIETYTDSGEWAYSISEGDGYKMPIADAENVLDTRDFTKLVFKYPPMVFEGLIVTKNSDGSKTVQFDVANDLFHQLYTHLLEDMNARMGTENINDIRIRNAHVKITIEDGNVRDYDMTFDMTSTVDEVTNNISVSLELDYIAFGDDVVITPPEGYLDFPFAPKEDDGSAVLDPTNQNNKTEE